MATEHDQHGRDDERERTWTAVPRFADSSEKHAFLLVLAGPQLGEIHPLGADRELLVGRSHGADVYIRDDGVSRRHASLRVERDEAVLADLGSANGTWVDGKRVTRTRVRDGARIQVGGHTVLKFVWADELDARYQMKLAEGALQDPLTGVYNRRHFDERLGSEIAAAQRHGRPLALLLVDVDRFKAVNDEAGHLGGDEALKTVALVIRGVLRREDVLARYGGDEFVVIARETALEGARALGERIRRAVERTRCAWQGRHLAVTVSVGLVAAAGFELVPGTSERELIEAADRALYAAKDEGRNRIAAAAAPGGERP